MEILTAIAIIVLTVGLVAVATLVVIGLGIAHRALTMISALERRVLEIEKRLLIGLPLVALVIGDTPPGVSDTGAVRRRENAQPDISQRPLRPVLWAEADQAGRRLQPEKAPEKEGNKDAEKEPDEGILTLGQAIYWAARDAYFLDKGYQQAQAVAVARRWQKPADPLPYTRYLWNGHVKSLKERIVLFKVLAGAVNQMSANTVLTPPWPVPTGETKDGVPTSNYALLRIDIRNYQPTYPAKDRPFTFRTEVYERLADVETNFNIRVRKVKLILDEEKGQAQVQDAAQEPPTKPRPRSRGVKSKRLKKPKKKIDDTPALRATPKPATNAKVYTEAAPWLYDQIMPGGFPPVPSTLYYADLLQRTHSQVPILFGTFFLAQVGTAENRSAANPGYYEFLDVKTIRDFENLGAFVDDPTDNHVELLEAIKRSGVSRKARRVELDETKGGLYARTFDNAVATGTGNPLKVLDKRFFTFEAIEAYIPSPGKMWLVGAFNKDGTTQPFVPGLVGGTHAGLFNRHRILVPTDCIECHNNGGLQDIEKPYFRVMTDEQRSQLIRLQSPDYETAKLLQQQYARPMEPLINAARLQYAIALHRLTGMSTKEYAQAFNEQFQKWAEGDVDLEQAARELGTSPDGFQLALKKFLLSNGAIDTTLTTYISHDKNEWYLPREIWDESYGLAQFILRGQIPADFVLPAEDNRVKYRKAG